MAVALLTKTHLDCSVAFWDVREDLRHPPRAAVSIGSPRQWGYDIDPLGLLVPLVAIRHVHNLGARSLPFAGSFMEMLGGMADELLEGAAVAQAFKARTAPAALATAAAADMWFERTGEPMAAEKLITGIP